MDEVKNENLENQDTTADNQCREQLQIQKERYIYLTAEFDNYKKRSEKERGQWYEHAQDAVIIDFLPVIDDIERALKDLQGQSLSPQDMIRLEGIEMIAKEFLKMLKKYDVEEIMFMSDFNPEFFEAVMQVTAENQVSGSVVAILQKGYVRRGRILRPAKVSVAQ